MDIKKFIPTTGLQLSPIEVKQSYLSEWNESCKDFYHLTKDGELIDNYLYRIGGYRYSKIRPNNPIKDEYFLLLRHIEATYSDEFLISVYPEYSSSEIKKKKKHLEEVCCIFDKNGVEKKVFKQFDSPYLLEDSCIYSLHNKYYNIETGEHYGSTTSRMISKEFLFLDNTYGNDEEKKGIMKINKKTGIWEVFK